MMTYEIIFAPETSEEQTRALLSDVEDFADFGLRAGQQITLAEIAIGAAERQRWAP
jgi:hypothetical protein